MPWSVRFAGHAVKEATANVKNSKGEYVGTVTNVFIDSFGNIALGNGKTITPIE